MLRFMRRYIHSTGVAIATGIQIFCVGHCAVEYGAEVTFLSGPSMSPTFNEKTDNNVVVTEKISSRLGNIYVGDVVIAKSPYQPLHLICKRVAALPGDRVIRNEGKYIDSPEKYIEIPRGHVWLLGDNSDNSTDSRTYGPVPIGLLRGRVFLKIWPLSEFGWIT